MMILLYLTLRLAATTPVYALFSLRHPFQSLAFSSSFLQDQITSIRPTVITNSSSTARYGHSAIYVESQQTLLFIGGQVDVVGNSGTAITNSVLSLDLGTNSTKPVNSNLSLPRANAFAASTMTSSDSIWSIGGIPEGCGDPSAYVLKDGKWTTPIPSRVPPRRRQAQAISVHNTTTGKDDVYVFGGIAEPFTCSLETIGYLGIDRWSTATNEVEILPWTLPATSNERYEPPISDYSATLLGDGKTIAIIGGQSSDGRLASMNQVLLFDTSMKQWSIQDISGGFPPARMGHAAVKLSAGAILISQGVGMDREPLSDLYLLQTNTKSSSSKSTTPPAWTWIKTTNTALIPTPARAWHSATLINDGQIVYAFGIGPDGTPVDDMLWLNMTATGTFSWKPTFTGFSKVIPIKTVQQVQKNIKMEGFLAVNPKAPAYLSADVSINPTVASVDPNIATSVLPTNTPMETPIPVSAISIPSSMVSQPDPVAMSSSISPDSLPTSTVTIPPTPTDSSNSFSNGFLSTADYTPELVTLTGERIAATAINNNPFDGKVGAVDASLAKKTAIAGGSVGAAIGLSALVATAMLIAKRRSAAKNQPELIKQNSENSNFTGPPVSTLMYTRARAGRDLSLGSTATHRGGPGGNTGGGVSVGGSDPFADETSSVNELGQLSRQSTLENKNLTLPTLTTPEALTGIGSVGSTISAASYPYLGGFINRIQSRDSDLNDSNDSHQTEGRGGGISVPLFFDLPQQKRASIIGNDSDIIDRGMRPTLYVETATPASISKPNLPFALPQIIASSPFTGGLSIMEHSGAGGRRAELRIRNPSDE